MARIVRLGLLLALVACGKQATYNPTVAAPQAPGELTQPTNGGAYCSFSCPWNNGQKRVVHGPSILCAYGGKLYGGTSYPQYTSITTIQTTLDGFGVPKGGDVCPCTYDASYDTTYTGAVGCGRSYGP